MAPLWLTLSIATWCLYNTPVVFGGLACLSDPCVHGVCLDDLNSTYACFCEDGYTGHQCQTEWNECWSSPCLNGGTCIDLVAAYACTCSPAFRGSLCEEEVNECESNPCQNGGTCQDRTGGYECTCLYGYDGVHCEVDISVCNATWPVTRCLHGGTCIDGQGAEFYCNCTTGWEGPLCETEVDECDSSPCQNGGVCLNLIGSYQCACQFGFTGPNCESQLILCQHNPCLHEGLCVMEGDQFRCYCVPDYNGLFCQHRYNECLPEPKCFNGGTCLDDVDGFLCSCPPPFTGTLCECVIGFNETSCPEIVRPTFPPKPLWPFPWTADLQPNLTSTIYASDVTTTEEASSAFVQSTVVFSVTNTSLPLDPDYGEGTAIISYDITISPTTYIDTSPTLRCKDYDYYGDCVDEKFSSTIWSSFPTESVLMTDVITPSFLETSFSDIFPTPSIDLSEFLTSIFTSPSTDTDDLFSSTDDVDYTAVLESSFIYLSTVENDFSTSIFFDHSSTYFDGWSISVTDPTETSLTITDTTNFLYEEKTSPTLIDPTPTWEAETESSITKYTTEFDVVAENQTFFVTDPYSNSTTTSEDTYTHDTLSDRTLPQTLPITTTETPVWNESLVRENDSLTSATTSFMPSEPVSVTTSLYDLTNDYANSSYETESGGTSKTVETQPFSESTIEITSELTPTKRLVNESFIYVSDGWTVSSTNPTDLISTELISGNESTVTSDGWSRITTVTDATLPYGIFYGTKSSEWTFESSFQTETTSETSQASWDTSATGVDGQGSQPTREGESATNSFWGTSIASSSQPLSTLDGATTAASDTSSTFLDQTEDPSVPFSTSDAMPPTDVSTITGETSSASFEQTEELHTAFSTIHAATSSEISTIVDETSSTIYDQTEEPSVSFTSTPTELGSWTTYRVTVTEKDDWTPSVYEPRISTTTEDTFEYTDILDTSTTYGGKETTEDDVTGSGFVTSPTNSSELTTPDKLTSYTSAYPSTSETSVEDITQPGYIFNFTEQSISTEVTSGWDIENNSSSFATLNIIDQTSITEDAVADISTEMPDGTTEIGLSSEEVSTGFVDVGGISTDSEFLVTTQHPVSTILTTEKLSTSTEIQTLPGNDDTSTWYPSSEMTESTSDMSGLSRTSPSTTERSSTETSDLFSTYQHTGQESSVRTPTEEFSRENTAISSLTTAGSILTTIKGETTGDGSTEGTSMPTSTDVEFTQEVSTQVKHTSVNTSSTTMSASTMFSTMSWFTPILTPNMTDTVTLSRTTRDEGSSTKVVDVFSTYDYNSSCFKWPCLNGGSCVVTENGPQCRCRWRFQGPHCEVPLNISTPAFYGHSHLTFDLNRANLTSDNDLRITVEFQSVSTSGILLFLHDGLGHAVNRFFLIFLEYGTIKFRFSCGNHHMSMMETKQNVSNGNVQVLTLRIAWLTGGQCLGSIRLNDTYTLEGRQTVDSNVWGKDWPRLLYLGGIPASVAKPAAAQFLRGFRGCILFLNIQDQPVSFWDATGGWGITQCLSPQCAMHNCMHQGTCVDGDKGPVCLCSPGYEGEFCERKVCIVNPCQAGGTCLASGNSVLCLCPYEREGEYCEQETPMPRPMLQGSVQGYASFISYELPTKVEEAFELQVHFVTQDLTQVAVILYMGKPHSARKKDNEKHVDFLAVSLVRGHVALTWDLGSGTRRIFTPFAVNPDVGAHRIGVGRKGRVSWLQVDSQPRVSARSPGILHSLNVNELYVGGHEAYNLSALPSDLPFHSSFRGCIFGLSFKGEVYEHEALVPRVLKARNLRRCPYAFCRSRCDKGKCGLALQETNDLPFEAMTAINDASPDSC